MRAELGLPPARWVASLRGSRRALAALVDAASLPEGVERLGPLPLGAGEEQELILRADRAHGAQVAAAIAVGKAIRSARKEIDSVQAKVGTVPGAP